MATLKHEEKASLRTQAPKQGGYPSVALVALDGEKDWSEDALVVGNYQLTRLVGQGGFGAVYEAQHVTLKNSFAVKLLQPQWAKEEKFFERFQREALVMAELRHENVVQVIDFGVSEQLGPYLICEWLEGKSLYRLWRLNRNLKWGWVLALMLQLLDALVYAHEKGIVHRDLKPENIIMTMGSRGRLLVKIVDFGIAHIVGKHFQQQSEKQDELHQRGAAIGTPYYMSPEQVRGELDRIDHRTDLYACGIILAEMLTGQRVFEGGSNRDTMRLQLEALPPRLSELNPDREYPEILEAIVAKALAKDPAHRFQSAHEFNQTLEQAMRSVGIDPIWEDIYHDSGEATGLFPMPKRRDIQYKMIAPAIPPPRPLRSMMIGISVAVLLLLSGFVSVRTLYPPPPSTQPKPRVAAWIEEPRTAPPPAEVRDVPLPSAATSSNGTTATSSDGTGQTNADTKKTAASQEDDEPEVKINPRKKKRWRRPIKRKKKRVARLQRTQEGTPSSPRDTPTRTPEPAPRDVAPTVRREVAALLRYRITTTPNGASVFVDGKKVGVTPLTIRGEVGKRIQIEIKKEGFVSRAYLWTFRQNSQNSFRLIEELL